MTQRRENPKPRTQHVRHANDEYQERTIIKSLPKSYHSDSNKSKKIKKQQVPIETKIIETKIIETYSTEKKKEEKGGVIPQNIITGKLNKINDDYSNHTKIQKQNDVQQSNSYSKEQEKKKEDLRQKQLQHQQIHKQQIQKIKTFQLIPGLNGPLDKTKKRGKLGYVYIKSNQSDGRIKTNINSKTNINNKMMAEGTIRKMSQLFPDKKSI
jgi:hypothetical protein